MRLSFYGGTQVVTGANYLLDTGKTKILVECGLFQGQKKWRHKNKEPLPYDPKEIEAVFVTHAHLDHIGRLPHLYSQGFRGKVYGTEPTYALTKLSLEDSAKLHQEQAKYDKEPPPYDLKDVEGVLNLFEGVRYDQEVVLNSGARARFRDAGHILGSAIIELRVKRNGARGEEVKLVFSGDLGNPPVPLLRDTEFIKEADYVLIETAYGDREHESAKGRKLKLERAIEETCAKGGVIMVPSFALERTQEILYELNDLVENNRIPKIQIFIDSPLANKVTEVYRQFESYFDREAAYLIKSGDDIFKFPGLKLTSTVEESKTINAAQPPKLIIAGSGMSTGGRILHHEKRYLSDPKNLLLIVAYQVEGTLGREIFDGAKKVKIHKEMVPIRAKIQAIGGYSAHADQRQLRNWLEQIKKPIKHVFCVQGESGAPVFAQLIKDHLGIPATAPSYGESFEL